MHSGHKYLAIYLNDHLAGSTGGLELAKRMAEENAGEEIGAFLESLVEEIAADRRELQAIMRELDVAERLPKVALAWAGEKLARLKLNGELTGYSPLSRYVELEALSLGIEGKRLLWSVLAGSVAERVGSQRLHVLVDRAERQRADVERHRLEAARTAFGADQPAPA